MSKQLDWAKDIIERYKHQSEPNELEGYLIELAEAIVSDYYGNLT